MQYRISGFTLLLIAAQRPCSVGTPVAREWLKKYCNTLLVGTINDLRSFTSSISNQQSPIQNRTSLLIYDLLLIQISQS
jgi:hypothetical protein